MNFDFNLDPFENFTISLKASELKSKELNVSDFNAMSLSTIFNNKPSIRTVLFKGLRDQGFSFFSHYNGKKGSDILNNNNVALLFFWPYLDHQIRIVGEARKLSSQESDQYFQSRPRLSQIGAWASSQSAELSHRAEFESKITYFENKFSNQVIPRPETWGGFIVDPSEIEFWFAEVGRLHKRFVYSKTDANNWNRFMRYP